MTMKFSPKPWHFEAEPGQGAGVCDDDGLMIAEMHCTGENDAQVVIDGRLVAAAPELLQALVRLYQATVHAYEPDLTDAALRRAMAAMRKAVGDQV